MIQTKFKFEVDPGQELARKAELWFEDLKASGQPLPAVSETFSPDQPPSWFDQQKFLKAQSVVRKYFVSFYVSHLAGLLLGLQLPRSVTVLMVNGQHGSVSRLFRRYLSTQLHLKSWYEGDPFDPQSKAHQSMKQVRRMHQKVGHLMNTKGRRKVGEEAVWVSQYDMAVAQWAFIGLAVLIPDKCGLHQITREELELFVYLWRVVGHCNGIEDRFNVCSGSFEETYAYLMVILDKVYRPGCSRSPHPVPTGLAVSQGLVKALRAFNPSMQWTCFMKYWYKQLDIPVEIKLEGSRKRMRYQLMNFVLNRVLRLSVFHSINNCLFRLKIDFVEKRKRKIETDFEQKYPHLNYQRCPFSVNLDTIHEHVI